MIEVHVYQRIDSLHFFSLAHSLSWRVSEAVYVYEEYAEAVRLQRQRERDEEQRGRRRKGGRGGDGGGGAMEEVGHIDASNILSGKRRRPQLDYKALAKEVCCSR